MTLPVTHRMTQPTLFCYSKRCELPSTRLRLMDAPGIWAGSP